MFWYDHFLANGGAEQVSLQISQHLDITVHTAWADPALFTSLNGHERINSHNHAFKQHKFPTWSLMSFYRSQKPRTDAPYWLLTGVFSPLMMINKPKHKIGVIYFHTFPSFVHETYEQLSASHGRLKALVFRGMCKLYTQWLKKAVAKSNRVFVNSHSVQKRFKQYLGIDAEVLYPPVEVGGLEHCPTKGYFLSSARLEPNKQVELILAAFEKRPMHTLFVAGGGTLLQEMKAKYADCKNIHFLGWQSQSQMKTLYNYSKALIYLPKNEYFGIAPVEAMAAGKPVISVAEGGILETVTDPRCGSLLNPGFTMDDLCHAIDTLSVDDEEATFRQKHARQFDAELFYQSLTTVLTNSE
ncbi:mannosyltransferase [Alteromonas sp. KUL42]|uniref:glycosyltransferase n=1 Tax=Alteromonas sp. KUL42 TaxID=2480797 RepID=UPI0010356D56|nr:glycosyltransferase [Alteromonas sp. KUL42]TAP35562.1 glycosyltransferase [Alteromonas sp. KUL42]GEA07037.1 mannosyltransferase [Alteromonas sp. KUL42]